MKSVQSCFSNASRNAHVLHVPTKSIFKRECLFKVSALPKTELETLRAFEVNSGSLRLLLSRSPLADICAGRHGSEP